VRFLLADEALGSLTNWYCFCSLWHRPINC